MKFWSAITWLANCLTLSPVSQDAKQQSLPGPLGLVSPPSRISGIPNPVVVPAVGNGVPALPVGDETIPEGPIFKPITGREHWGGSNFQCEYTHADMKGYVPCSGDDRSCWLRNEAKNHSYGIGSNYEDPSSKNTPIGIVRDYTLVVEDGIINTDGLWSRDAKLVNGTYPGPWIQACWGDTVRVKVINKLKYNGTAVHFHGVRQLKASVGRAGSVLKLTNTQTMQADGVPGITQCPIAPNDYFVYEFKVLQYGSSWYHSHYSVQYADGVLGPMTFHGPSTAYWDEPKTPLLMTDWFHNSAFSVIHGKVPGYTTALLNGTGDVTMYRYPERGSDGKVLEPPKNSTFTIQPNAPVPPKYTLNFEKKKRYLLRLINTSFASNFVFSIDHHKFIVVGADFVPVYDKKKEEKRTHIQIGIGQRYTVIVEADPQPPRTGEKNPERENFWIRTQALTCFKDPIFTPPENTKTGILRYDPLDIREPTTKAWDNIDTRCKDDFDLVPSLPWDVPKIPSNSDKPWGEELSVGFQPDRKDPIKKKYPLATWSFGRDGVAENTSSLQIDYDNPFFLNLHNVSAGKENSWAKKWVVIPESFTDKDWVFLAITQREFRAGKAEKNPAHPYAEDVPFDPKNASLFKAPRMNWNNPLRRDVVLLPSQGWFIMAFKADNPGSWIMHCHIAFHASEGLALQINERQEAADKLWPNPQPRVAGKPIDLAIRETERVCKRWKDFHHDCTQHWPGKNEKHNCWPACQRDNPLEEPYACPKDLDLLPPDHLFQDDSGI